ncbi:MAG TPA: hypothetical protein VML55_17185 [Planctomycetaceae bacterium]|nr:hypothetical protein [Planctomycetaceae bacterium]
MKSAAPSRAPSVVPAPPPPLPAWTTRCRRALFQPRALAVLALGVFLAAAAPRLV